MKLKFWQKACAIIWVAFLLCLTLVCGAIYYSGRQRGYRSELTAHLNSQAVLVQQLAKDVSALQARKSDALPALYQVYGDQYRQQGATLEVYDSGECVYSNLAPEQTPDGTRTELQTYFETKTYLVYQTDEGRRLFIGACLPAELGHLVVVYSADMETFYLQWEGMFHLLLAAGAGAALLFGMMLYALLCRMYQPLAVVTKTAAELGSGNMAARAEIHRKDEFGELAHTLNTMADTVQQQMEQLKQVAEQRQRLTENLAHELRTPLAAISGWAETMRGVELTPQEQAEALDEILFESRRVTSLSRQMLELSVLQHDETLQKTAVSVESLLLHTKTALQPLAKSHDVILDVSPAAFDTVQGDTALLESLLCNLCENAIKASKSGGAVQLTTDTHGGKRFLVRDSGRGMTAETLKHLGQPFYREDKARSRSEGGAGLGVALCFEIARRHGATLTYESEIGKGTTAILTFTT